METKRVTAAELRGPEDCGSHITKGSLVRRHEVSWRVQAVRETHSGYLEIVAQEERAKDTMRNELMGPRCERWPLKATEQLDVVIEQIEGVGPKPESGVYGFEVTGEDDSAANDMFRALATWLDGEADPPAHELNLTGDGTTFEFRAELTVEGHRLFADAREQALRFKSRIKVLRLFTGPSRSQPLPN